MDKAVWAGPEEGASLLELLAGVAVTVVVFTTLTLLFVTQVRAQKDLQVTTNLYDDLRIPAQSLLQDARFAVIVDSCARTSVGIYTSLAGDYVQYRFGAADPQNLHRVQTIGGTTSDDVVGWNLVPPSAVPITTKFFSCNFTPGHNYVQMHLEKYAAKPDAPKIILETRVFLRNN